jgi:hypothetical protein
VASNAFTVPARDLAAGGNVCIPIPRRIIPYLIGALNPLCFPDMWTGDDSDIKRSVFQMTDFVSSLVGGETCPDCPEPEACPTFTRQDALALGLGGAIIEEEADMGQVVTDVQLVDGKIRVYFGPCCYKDLEGFVVDSGDTIDPTINEGAGGGGGGYSACGKATAIQTVVNKIVQASFDALDEAPWDYVSSVEHYVGYNLKDKYVAACVLSCALVFDGFGWGYADVYDVVEQSETLCQLYSLFSDDSAGVPTNELNDQIRQAFLGPMGANVAKGAIWSAAIDSLGRDNMDTIAKLGALDLEAECDCDTGGIGLSGLYFTGQYLNTDEVGSEYGTIGIVALSGSQKKASLRWTVPTSGTFTQNTEINYLNVDAPGVQTVELKFTGEVPRNAWSVPCDVWDDTVCPGHFNLIESGISQTWTFVEAGSDYAIWRCEFTSGETPVNVHPTAWGYTAGVNARACPNDPGNNWVSNWAVEFTLAVSV